MPPFSAVTLVHGIKERIDALLLQGKSRNNLKLVSVIVAHINLGNTLYVGTSTGTLITHNVERSEPEMHVRHSNVITDASILDEGAYTTTPLETKRNFTRKSIEQLGYVRDVNSLVTLSGVSISIAMISLEFMRLHMKYRRNCHSISSAKSWTSYAFDQGSRSI